MKKKLTAFLVVLIMVLSTGPVSAYETSDIDIIADVFFARPGGIAAIAAGSAVFVLALPFSLPRVAQVSWDSVLFWILWSLPFAGL